MSNLDSNVDFRGLLQSVRLRRRMFLLDDRYVTLVGFITGCDAATDWRLLDGFNEWIADKILGHESSFHWSTIVAAKTLPHFLNEPRSGNTIPPADEPVVCDDLLMLLDNFLEAREKLSE
jgi:hypothetical protein